MRKITAQPNELLSIASYISTRRILDRMSAFSVKKRDRVPCILYEGCYLLGDGHHRSAIDALWGRDNELVVLETDYEVASCESGAFSFISTLKNFCRRYENTWGPNVRKHGVTTMDRYAFQALKDMVDEESLESLITISPQDAPFYSWLDILSEDSELKEKIAQYHPAPKKQS